MKCALVLTLCLLALISCGKDKSTEPDRVRDSPGPSPPKESLLWQYRTDNPGELVIVSPTVADGVVYVGSHDSYVYALDAESGELLWSFETASDPKPPPLVADGVVLVQDLGNLYALDASTGELLWRDDAVHDPLISDGTIYIPTSPSSADFSSAVSAVDVASGEQLWTAEVSRSEFPLLFPLTLTGKNIYVSDYHAVHVLDATTGELAWSFSADSPDSPLQIPPVVSGGMVYLVEVEREYALVSALDEATGAPTLELQGRLSREYWPPPSASRRR